MPSRFIENQVATAFNIAKSQNLTFSVTLTTLKPTTYDFVNGIQNYAIGQTLKTQGLLTSRTKLPPSDVTGGRQVERLEMTFNLAKLTNDLTTFNTLTIEDDASQWKITNVQNDFYTAKLTATSEG